MKHDEDDAIGRNSETKRDRSDRTRHTRQSETVVVLSLAPALGQETGTRHLYDRTCTRSPKCHKRWHCMALQGEQPLIGNSGASELPFDRE